MLRLAVGLAALALPAQAHEFQTLDIAAFERTSSNFMSVRLQDTVLGHRIVCAIYDSDGKLLASSDWRTDNLATEVLIEYAGDDAATARCVFNE